MPKKTSHVKNEKQSDALKDKGMPHKRVAKIADSPPALQPRRREVRLWR